ncbi:hypothetical protein [Nostoc sp.]|uniref:hypothetical protein n=1 Tax=Nostoc sp. TaxID=1180 RepID=UPI002FF9E3FA
MRLDNKKRPNEKEGKREPLASVWLRSHIRHESVAIAIAMNRWHRLCLIPGGKPHCFNQIVHEYIDARNYPYK